MVKNSFQRAKGGLGNKPLLTDGVPYISPRLSTSFWRIWGGGRFGLGQWPVQIREAMWLALEGSKDTSVHIYDLTGDKI